MIQDKGGGLYIQIFWCQSLSLMSRCFLGPYSLMHVTCFINISSIDLCFIKENAVLRQWLPQEAGVVVSNRIRTSRPYLLPGVASTLCLPHPKPDEGCEEWVLKRISYHCRVGKDEFLLKTQLWFLFFNLRPNALGKHFGESYKTNKTQLCFQRL